MLARARALIVGALAVLVMVAAAPVASASEFTRAEFTWTIDASGTARFDACESNFSGGVPILRYTWRILRPVAPGAYEEVAVEVLAGADVGPDYLCDDFTYEFTERGWYRVVLEVLDATGGEAGVGHDVFVPQADLAVSVSESADPVTEDQPVRYTIELTNNGPDAASNVVLTDGLGAGASFDVVGSGGMTCSLGSVVTCEEAVLAAGETVTVVVRAFPHDPGTLTNSARVSSDTEDPDTTNNHDSESTTVDPEDATPPTVAGVPDREPNAAGWYAGPVTIDWQATDPAPSSGSPSDPPDTVASTEGAGVVYTSDPSCDPAGNCATGTLTLSTDMTAPTVVGVPDREPNAAGWYAGPVTIDWQATDPAPGSGVATSSPDTVASTEGSGVAYTSDPSCDVAGHCATGSLSLSIDTTPPVVTCESPAPVFRLGETRATVSAGVADALSGTESALVAAVADTSSVGARSVSLTGRDLAGNVRTVSCPFLVAYVFEGFFSPVDSGGVLNVVKAGRAIPIKWRLTDAAGAPVTNLTTAAVSVQSLNCSLGTSADLLEETTAGGSGLQNLGNGYYQLNWKTPSSYAGSCKTMRLDLGEALLHTALFKFTT